MENEELETVIEVPTETNTDFTVDDYVFMRVTSLIFCGVLVLVCFILKK